MSKTNLSEAEENRNSVRMFVRLREDFQSMRKRIDNRLGLKANGEAQAIDEGRPLQEVDAWNFLSVSAAARAQEKEIEKMLRKVLKRFPIYTEWLKGVKGVGEISAGWILAEFDIHEATTVSKMWQFCGLNPGMVIGKERVENKDGSFSYVATDKLIRGDKLTSGFVAPFNKRLRVALAGVMADGFIKQQNEYCMKYYYPYKARLEQESNKIEEIKKKGGKVELVEWKEAKKAHRHRAAIRYMLKMFLKDLYVAWRTIEGLEVRAPYQEEYLGHKHAG